MSKPKFEAPEGFVSDEKLNKAVADYFGLDAEDGAVHVSEKPDAKQADLSHFPVSINLRRTDTGFDAAVAIKDMDIMKDEGYMEVIRLCMQAIQFYCDPIKAMEQNGQIDKDMAAKIREYAAKEYKKNLQ